MMKVLLDKLIRKLIIGKYPFIQDFEINEKYFSSSFSNGKLKKIGVEKYVVIYYVTPDEDGDITVTKDFKEVAELTETCFNALGPEHYQRFDDVEFHSTETK
jgi:hypothetical protein